MIFNPAMALNRPTQKVNKPRRRNSHDRLPFVKLVSCYNLSCIFYMPGLLGLACLHRLRRLRRWADSS